MIMFLIGLVLGSCIGLIVAALMVSNHRNEIDISQVPVEVLERVAKDYFVDNFNPDHTSKM